MRHDNRQFNDVATSATVKTTFPSLAPYFTLGNGWQRTIKPNFLFLWQCLLPILLNLISWAPFVTQTVTLNTPLSCKNQVPPSTYLSTTLQDFHLTLLYLDLRMASSRRHSAVTSSFRGGCLLKKKKKKKKEEENSWQRISIHCLGFGDGKKKNNIISEAWTEHTSSTKH